MNNDLERPKKAPLPSDSQKKAIEEARERVKNRAPRVKIELKQPDSGKIEFRGGGHSDQEGWLKQLEDVFGTRGTDFTMSQLNQLMTACADENGKIDGARVNAMLAMVQATRPENELQAALAVQMAVTHFATMTLMSRALRADQIRQFDAAGNMTVKLARTFVLQAEALAKLQRGGEQIVKVVHVHPGGQAIVGNVTPGTTGTIGTTGPGGGVADENRNQPHAKAIEAAAAPPNMSPMRRQDQERQTVSVARREG